MPGEAVARVRVIGSSDWDWWIERTTNWVDWVRVGGEVGAPRVGGSMTGAPERAIPTGKEPWALYRATRTDGLYDSTVLRSFTVSLDMADWDEQLVKAHDTGSNVLCRLDVDNGVQLTGVGARYKGYSSFSADLPRKSLNLEVNFTNNATELLRYETLNLNNAHGDWTRMREPLYFNAMRQYAPCPRGALAKVSLQGEYLGVYSLAQQEDSDLIREWFPNAQGDRWRAPNKTRGSSMNWLGPDVSSYAEAYELKKTFDTDRAWTRLVHAIDVLHHTPTSRLRDALEEVYAVDSWLWFLAVENVFTDDDAYWNKGADYSFYCDAEAGRIYPVQHDGNESFVVSNTDVSPTFGETEESRPMLSRLLAIPELRQRYFAHMRTVLDEVFRPDVMTAEIDRLSALSVAAVEAETRREFTMEHYFESVQALKTFVTNRHAYLTQHEEVNRRGPRISSLSAIGPLVAGQTDFLTARVMGDGAGRVGSVWLWYRAGPSGRYTRLAMYDDGVHLDGRANDGIYGVQLAAQLGGVTVRYYIEARAADAQGTATFHPPHAEVRPLTYKVGLRSGTGTPVVINEVMANNKSVIADPQGEFDDWIELRNVSEESVDLSGWYLSDDETNPRKWAIPPGTTLEAGGYLLIWADEDGSAGVGLHANFKLSAGGETLWLVDSDENLNVLRDRVEFGVMAEDAAVGRLEGQPGQIGPVSPTPGKGNR